MKTLKFISTKSNLLFIVALAFFSLSFTPKLGLDFYDIYLNDKLIMKQFVNQPLNLRTLQLEKAAPQDQLWIRYTHCNKEGSGSDRTIVLKDEKGHLLTEWKFADSGLENTPMKVSVAELLKLEKEHQDHQISLFYKSKELQKSELLAYLQR